mmetsp:Transcript_6886/g.16341  ORF Transcript_6886/g.16341 Transcript_6886/m.16341 type:complete len:1045 (+) Transcript_6886:108-3242(+)
MVAVLSLLVLGTACTSAKEVEGTIADFAGAGGVFLEALESSPIEIERAVSEPKASTPGRGPKAGRSFVVGAASGLLLDLAAREVMRRELIPKLAIAAEEQFQRGRDSLARLRGRPAPVAEVPVETVANEPRPTRAAALAGLMLLGAMVIKATKRRGWGKKPVPEPAAAKAKAKAKAKAPPPPPRRGAPKASPRGKANSLDEGMLSPRSAEFARFGKRIHWIKPTCEPNEDTIFGELKMVSAKSEDTKPKLQFDKDLMDAMFTPRSARTPTATPRKSWTGPKPQGICLLDNSRAHNIAIVLTKLAISTEELSRSIRCFDTGQQKLKADHVDLLNVAMPTASEVTKLQAQKHKVEDLRDVERRMMPLCSLSPARIKVMKFALTHKFTCDNLMQRCKVLKGAAEQTRNSPQFKELLAVILEAGNYINGEPGEQQAVQVRAFSIESLQSLANFKVGCISCMHFLCITMRASDTSFLSFLEDSLKHVRLAAKERFSQLRAEVETFLGEVNFARARLREMTAAPKAKVVQAAEGDAGPAEGEEKPSEMPWPEATEEVLARERLAMLVEDYNWQAHQLRIQLAQAEQASVDVQCYFSTTGTVGSPGRDKETSQAAKLQRVPPEQFFGYISGFLDMVKTSWNEIDGNPAKWRQFSSSADRCKASGTSFARRIQNMEPGKTDSDASPRRGSSSVSVCSVVSEPVSPRLGPSQAEQSKLPIRLPERPTSPKSVGSQEIVTPRRSLPGSQQSQNGLVTPRTLGSKEVGPQKVSAAAAKAKVPKLNLKMQQSPRPVKQTPRSGRKWSEDQNMQSFVASLDGTAVAGAFEVLKETGKVEEITAQYEAKAKAKAKSKAPCRPTMPKLALKELQQLQPSESVSSSSTYAVDKGAESSTSSSTEDGRAAGADEGYISCSSEGLAESPASAGSPNFAPQSGPGAKVPPLKIGDLAFGRRGITPSFGGSSPPADNRPHSSGIQSPRRLLSARSGEDSGTARKLASHRSERLSPLPQTCEVHQMNDSTDCEYHKLADSDSESCATQSDEEFEGRKRIGASPRP